MSNFKSHATVFDHPIQIRLAQLCSARAAIKLEKLGLRHSRIRCGVRGLWAKHYRMPLRSKHDAVIARITQEIKELEEKLNGQQPELPL